MGAEIAGRWFTLEERLGIETALGLVTQDLDLITALQKTDAILWKCIVLLKSRGNKV